MKEKTEIVDMDGLVNRMLVVAADSPVYKKIAAYIEQYHMQIIFMTAGELANELSVSQGSVSKFCIALGYRGYSEFLRNLQKFVGKEMTAPERFHYTSANRNQTNDVIEKEMDNFQMLKEIASSKIYEKLVDAIADASEIILLSARMSATLLPYMKYIMEKLGNNVRIVTPETNEWDYLNVKYKDKEVMIIALGLPRYPRVLVEKIKELKELNMDLWIITDSRFSPLCEYSENSIFIPTTVASIFDIYSTPIAFINLLLTDVSKKIPGIEERLDEIEQYEIKHHVYY